MRDSKFMRGQIWWMEGYEVHKSGGKTRPALIISNNNINGNMANENITVLPLTSNTERTDIPTNVVFDRWNRTKNIIKCSDIVTIYKHQLVSYESTVDEETMEKVEQAISLALALIQSPCAKLIETDHKNFIADDSYQPCEPKEEKMGVSYLSGSEKEINTSYTELMQAEVKRQGKKVIWDAETEYLFMRIYTECGIEEAAKKFDMAFKSATTRAYLLRKKYPEFEKLKVGRRS